MVDFNNAFSKPTLSYGGVPMSCTEFSTSANYTESAGNTTYLQYYSAKLSMFKNETSSYIKVYDINGFDSSVYGGYITAYCFSLATETCLRNISENYAVLDISNTYETKVRFDITFSDLDVNIFNTFFDDETISQYDGVLYSPEYPCTKDATNNATTCCTTFVPAPEISETFPRCKYFRSRTIVHNPADYSIVATVLMNYFMLEKENSILLKGNFSGATNVMHYINNIDISSVQGLNGSMFLPRDDVKFFIASTFSNGFYEVPHVRLFLIRNGQTLMKESVPYTKDNDCQYYSVKDNRQQMPVSIEVCCKEFE